MAKQYQNTISGLLKKRAELLGETHKLQAKLAAVQNAIESVDRVLFCFGHTTQLEGMRPIGTRTYFFDRNGVRRFILTELRSTSDSVSSRQLAGVYIVRDGRDPSDQQLLSDMVDRVGKGLRLLRRDGVVTGERDKMGLMKWHLIK